MPIKALATCGGPLEGTENRITVARNRCIQTVQENNVTKRSFPTNLTAMAFC
jgi:LemA protein